MSLFDSYIPEPALRCPVCDFLLTNWQGKDGPCLLLTWQQGVKFPVAHELPEESVDDSKSFLESWSLPPRFEIYSDECRCGRLIEAYGICEQGVWSRTEIVTHLNYCPDGTTSEGDARRIRNELQRWLEGAPH